MMKNNAGRAKVAIIGLKMVIIGLIALILVYVLAMYMRYSFRSGPRPSREFVDFAIVTFYLGFLFFAVTFVVCAMTFILWFTRAYRNLHILLPSSEKQYPFWTAAIVWFIPVFNLVVPYQIATELFDRTERYLLSKDVMDLRPKYDVIKGTWWAISVTFVVIVALSIRYMFRNLHSNIGHLGQMAGFMLAILAALLAIRMIKNYREMEKLIQQVERGSDSFSLKEGDLLD